MKYLKNFLNKKNIISLYFKLFIFINNSIKK